MNKCFHAFVYCMRIVLTLFYVCVNIHIMVHILKGIYRKIA